MTSATGIMMGLNRRRATARTIITSGSGRAPARPPGPLYSRRGLESHTPPHHRRSRGDRDLRAVRDHSGCVVSRKYLNSAVDGSRPELEQFRKGITSLDCREATMSDMDSSADRPWTLEAVQQLSAVPADIVWIAGLCHVLRD